MGSIASARKVGNSSCSLVMVPLRVSECYSKISMLE